MAAVTNPTALFKTDGIANLTILLVELFKRVFSDIPFFWFLVKSFE